MELNHRFTVPTTVDETWARFQDIASIAECFPGRLRYSGASIGYQLASVIAGGPAPLIVAWLLAQYKSGWVIAVFILVCAVISMIATMLLPDNTNRELPDA